ncbi:kinesin-like protein KIF2A-like protein [Gorgonomyces haynaldii]|nr:kinesin-like protein KIF2A-like protein [Gorgonomyces haynaldii]
MSDDRASQARLAKLKQRQEERAQDGPQIQTSALSVQLSQVPVRQKQTNSSGIMFSQSLDDQRASEKLLGSSPKDVIARSSSPQSFTSPKSRFMSKAAQEVEKLRVQREERRQKQLEFKELKESMNEKEVEIMQYRQAIDRFRIEFAKKRAQLKIRLNTKERKQTKQSKIKVCVRKRPLNQKEATLYNFDIVTTATDDHPFAHVYLHEPKVKLDRSKEISTHRFSFDHVFDENATNRLVYDATAKPLVESFLKGSRVTLFAFGQTGSGKTYTIFGNGDKSPGIFELACRQMFTPALPQDTSLHLSFFEIYSGRVYDLLSNRQRLSILEDSKGVSQVVGHKEIQVASLEQVLQIVKLGTELRTTGTTEANSQSSRSHAIIQLSLKKQGERFGNFFIVDLAGSERGVDTGNIGRNARMEGSEINKSLLVLKECIRALYIKKKKGMRVHIPFRATKLTQVLRDSFVGKGSETVMIAMMSPGSSSAEHTLNTLRYADRVKEFREAESAVLPQATDPSPTELQMQIPDFEEDLDKEDSEDDSFDHGITSPAELDDLKDLGLGDLDLMDIEDALMRYRHSSEQAHEMLEEAGDPSHSMERYVYGLDDLLQRRIEMWQELQVDVKELISKIEHK